MKVLPFVLIALALPGCNYSEETSAEGPQGPKPADHEFMSQAAQANFAEIDAGRLAMGRTVNPGIRDYAQHMVDDHSASNLELRDLASKKNFLLPEMPDQSHLKRAGKLGELSGNEFDRKYMELMVDDHIQAVKLFDKNTTGASDPDVRAWAATTLPKLIDHLTMSRDLFAKVISTYP